jgi:hypothetical protein
VRRKVIVVLVLLVLLVGGGAAIWAWHRAADRASDGVVSGYRVGERVTLGSGLSLTIPPGHVADGDDFGSTRWSKGADSMGRSDYLIVGVDATDTEGNYPSVDTMWMSVYDASSRPDYTGMGGGTLIAKSPAASVYVVNWTPKGSVSRRTSGGSNVVGYLGGMLQESRMQRSDGSGLSTTSGASLCRHRLGRSSFRWALSNKRNSRTPDATIVPKPERVCSCATSWTERPSLVRRVLAGYSRLRRCA